MQNQNKAGIFLQFSFRFGFQAQKMRKLEADGEAEGRRGRGLGSNVGRLEEESWRRSPAQHFHTKAPSGPGRLSLRPSAWTHRRCAEGRKISRGSSSDRRLVCVWGGGWWGGNGGGQKSGGAGGFQLSRHILDGSSSRRGELLIGHQPPSHCGKQILLVPGRKTAGRRWCGLDVS